MIYDASILVILLIFVFWGTKRGAAKMLFSTVSYGISLFLGCILYRPICSLLEKAGITQGVATKITESGALDNLPGVILDVPLLADGTRTLVEAAAEAAVSAVGFIGVVVLARLVLLIVSAVIGVAGSLPVIKQVNGLAGGVLGFCLGLLIEFTALAAIAVLEAFAVASFGEELLQTGSLAAFMYNNNPLMLLFRAK